MKSIILVTLMSTYISSVAAASAGNAFPIEAKASSSSAAASGVKLSDDLLALVLGGVLTEKQARTMMEPVPPPTTTDMEAKASSFSAAAGGGELSDDLLKLIDQGLLIHQQAHTMMEPVPPPPPPPIAMETKASSTPPNTQNNSKPTQPPPQQKSVQINNPKNCFFVHGANREDTRPATDTFKDYWGESTIEYTPGCITRSFYHHNTRDFPPENRELQDHLCQFLQAKNGVVKNARIFTHSFGSIMLAAAIHDKTCVLEKTSTMWFQIQSPLKGSPAADKVVEVCTPPPRLDAASAAKEMKPLLLLFKSAGYFALRQNKKAKAAATVALQGIRDSHSVNSSVRKKLIEKRVCTERGARITYRALTTDYDYTRRNNLYDIAKANATGSMCGTTSLSYSPYSNDFGVLLLLSSIYGIFGDQGHDGLVTIDSCKVRELYGNRSNDLFYLLNGNHVDGTCRNGDGIELNQQPCSWLQNMSNHKETFFV